MNISHIRKTPARLLIYALIILPVVISFLYIKTYGVNVVYGDEWSFVPLLEKFYTGTLTFGDLFQGHNEHRMLFPRIIMLVLARLTHYNTIAEMYCSWTLAVLTLAIIYVMYRRDFGGSSVALLMFAPIAWLLLSLRQSESFLWGYELLMYLCVAGVVASIYMLGRRTVYAFVGAICCAIIASFSSANGLLAWPVGIVFIMLSERENKISATVAWAVVGIAIWVLYFHDWMLISSNPNIAFAFNRPFVALAFLIVNIGSPLALVKSSAIGLGAIICLLIVALFLPASIVNIRKNSRWIALILFSLSSSLLFTAGRASFGYWAALASRYFIFTAVGIIAVYVSLANYHDKAADPKLKERYAFLYGAILSVILVGIVCGYASGLVLGRQTRDARKLAAECLLDYRRTDDEKLDIVFYNIKKVRERAEFLEEYRLNVFHHNP